MVKFGFWDDEPVEQPDIIPLYVDQPNLGSDYWSDEDE